MAAKKKNIISKASPHTIKKFELIEEYIKSWAQKLLLTESCNGLIFIDCINKKASTRVGQFARCDEYLFLLQFGSMSI